MTCEICQERLVDYHYGELEPDERREVADHLASCGQCAVEYCKLHADLAGLGESFADGPRPAARQALREKVIQTFRPPWWQRLLRIGAVPIPAYQTALVIAGLLLVWFLVVAPRLDGTTAGEHTTVLSGYDASQVIRLDPNTL